MGDDGVAFSNRRLGCIGDDEIDGVLVKLPIDLKDRFGSANSCDERISLDCAQASARRSSGDGASAGAERASISGWAFGANGSAPVFVGGAFSFSRSEREARTIPVSGNGAMSTGAGR